MAKKPHLVAQPFEIQGKPVRIVAYDWRADEEYANADAEGIVEVYQVTWYEGPDILSGWLGFIQQFRDGHWKTGDKTSVAYPSPESAALKVVMDWIAYEQTLTEEDYEALAAKVIPVLAMPGAKPPPSPSPKRKKKPKKNPAVANLLRRALR